MKDDVMMKSILGCLIALCAASAAGCSHDVTNDPALGFSSLSGRCFVLRQGGFLWRNSFDSDWFLYPPGHFGMPSSVKVYEADTPHRRDANLKAQHEGTKIQIDKLEDTLDSSTHYHAYGRILDGPSKNTRVEMNAVLLRLREQGPGVRHWSVDERFLQGCSEAP